MQALLPPLHDCNSYMMKRKRHKMLDVEIMASSSLASDPTCFKRSETMCIFVQATAIYSIVATIMEQRPKAYSTYGLSNTL